MMKYTDEDVRRYLNALINDLDSAYRYFKLYQHSLFETEPYLVAINLPQNIAFFNEVSKSFRNCFIIKLSGFLEVDKTSSCNLDRFLTEIIPNSSFQKIDLEKEKPIEIPQNINTFSGNLSAFRGNHIAHSKNPLKNDKNYDGLSFENIEKIFDYYKTYINNISLELFKYVHAFNIAKEAQSGFNYYLKLIDSDYRTNNRP